MSDAQSGRQIRGREREGNERIRITIKIYRNRHINGTNSAVPIVPSGTDRTPSKVIGTVESSLSHPKSWVPKNSTSMYFSGTVRRVRVVVGYLTSFEINFAFIFMSCLEMSAGILERFDAAISAGGGGTDIPVGRVTADRTLDTVSTYER